MRPHVYRPLLESLEYRDNTGISWELPWLFVLGAFVDYLHLVKLPKISPKLIDPPSPLRPVTIPLPSASIVVTAPPRPVSAQGLTNATVVSAVGAPITIHAFPRPIHLPPHYFEAMIHSLREQITT
jgi:hypothetical protein